MIPGYSCADDHSCGIHPVYQSLLNPKELESYSSLNVRSRDKSCKYGNNDHKFCL